MPDVDDRRTVGEAYSVATGHGSISVKNDARSSGDVILAVALAAAGHNGHALGAILLRVQAEFDSIRQEVEAVQRMADRRNAEQRDISRLNAKDHCAHVIAWRATGAQPDPRDRTKDEIVTSCLLIYTMMKTLREAKQAVTVHAHKLAQRHRYHERDNVLDILAARALDVFLDERCYECHGTAVRGYRHLQDRGEQCGACRGTGTRRWSIGANERQRQFGVLLVGELQREASGAAGRGARLLAGQ